MKVIRYRVDLLDDGPRDRILDTLLGATQGGAILSYLFGKVENESDDYPGGLSGMIGDDVLNAVCGGTDLSSGLTISVLRTDDYAKIDYTDPIGEYLPNSVEISGTGAEIRIKVLKGDLEELAKHFVTTDYSQIRSPEILQKILYDQKSDWRLVEVAFSHGQPRLRFDKDGSKELLILTADIAPMSIAFEMPDESVYVFETREWHYRSSNTTRVVEIRNKKICAIYEFGAETTDRGYSQYITHKNDFMIVTQFLAV